MDFSFFLIWGITLAVYFVVNTILTWGLNIQFGYAGIPMFTYYTFVAAGAYFTGVATLGQHALAHQTYILGLGWPFPIPLIVGAAAAGLLGLAVGVFSLGRLRSDYLAIVTFSLGFIAYDFVSTYTPLFNGFEGIFGVPSPFNDTLNLDSNTYPFFFLIPSGLIMVGLWIVTNRIFNSPLGRSLRAVREDLDVAETLGKNTFRLRMLALVVGSIYAGIGGGLLIEFITAINPSGWAAAETFIIWAAMLIGGKGNTLGAALGSLIVPVLILEATRFIPLGIGPDPIVIESFRFVVVGALLILILWFRPDGILPEPKRRFSELPTVRGQ